MAEIAQSTPTDLGVQARRAPHPRLDLLPECALAAASLALVCVTVVPDAGGLAVSAALLGVVLPAGLGLIRLARHPDERFARLLLGAGALWALASLAQSSDGTLYSMGRAAAWVVEPALVYLILSYPSGRLTTTTQRAVAVATALVAGLLYLPTALLGQYPEPSPFAACGTDCPANAFALTESGAVLDVVRPLREVLTVMLWAAVAAAVVARSREAGPLLRRTLVPVAAIALFRAAVMGFYLVVRGGTGSGSSGLADALGWAYLMSLPGVTLAFAAGLLSQRLFVATALQSLTQRLRPHAAAADLRTEMARALRDPSLRILYFVDGTPGRWVDETGWPASLPEQDERLAVTEVESDGRPVAAIVHDGDLGRDPALIEAASAYALTALENERLARRLTASVEELRESRTRIVAAADTERRRIERNLHDGAQQRLVALRIKLDLLAERLSGDSADQAAYLRQLEHEIDETIDEVRSFARDLYPPLLVDRGLAEALRAAASRAPIRVTVDVPALRRYPPEVESTVYFACVEALQNAAKHAHGAHSARISVSANERLRFDVRDDGEGFDPDGARDGAGLTNMRDRLAALGGTLEVESSPGHGTRVTGVIPTP
jgi:signal transduction histidine kinase